MAYFRREPSAHCWGLPIQTTGYGTTSSPPRTGSTIVLPMGSASENYAVEKISGAACCYGWTLFKGGFWWLLLDASQPFSRTLSTLQRQLSLVTRMASAQMLGIGLEPSAATVPDIAPIGGLGHSLYALLVSTASGSTSWPSLGAACCFQLLLAF
jgi:hypothetical protein